MIVRTLHFASVFKLYVNLFDYVWSFVVTCNRSDASLEVSKCLHCISMPGNEVMIPHLGCQRWYFKGSLTNPSWPLHLYSNKKMHATIQLTRTNLYKGQLHASLRMMLVQ